MVIGCSLPIVPGAITVVVRVPSAVTPSMTCSPRSSLLDLPGVAAPRDYVGTTGHRHREAWLGVALSGEAFDALEKAVGARGGHRGTIQGPFPT